MDLVERYLNAVRFWLPKDRRDDILRELAEDIRSEVEEKEAGLGRPLTGPEVEVILKKRGRPSETAGRFLPPRYLIGPAYFPLYLFALKLAAWIGLGVAIVLPLALSYLIPSRMASPADVLSRSVHSLWTLGLTWLGAITLGFAAFESIQRGSGRADWRPSKLPPVRGGRRVSRASSVAEIVFDALFLSWWLEGFGLPELSSGDGSPLTLPPSAIWSDLRGPYLVPIALVLLAGILLAVVSLVRPQLSRARIAARAAIDAASAGLMASVLIAHREGIRHAFRAIRAAAEGADRLAALRDWVLSNVLFVIAVGSAISLVVGLVRLARTPRPSPGGETA